MPAADISSGDVTLAQQQPKSQVIQIGGNYGSAVTLSTGAGGTRPPWSLHPTHLQHRCPCLLHRAFTNALIFVTDGDTGALCLALSGRGAWKRVPLGTTIAAN